MTAHKKGTTSIQITITHLKPVHVCSAVYLCVSKERQVQNVCFYFCLDLCVSSSQTLSFLGQGQKNSLWGTRPSQISSHWSLFFFFPSFSFFFLFPFAYALPQKKVPQATARNSRHPYIGRAISWPLYQYPQCLGLFTILLELEPTLPPSAPLCSYWVSEL